MFWVALVLQRINPNHIIKHLIFIVFLIQLGQNFILQLLGGIHMRIIGSKNYFYQSFVFKKDLYHSIWNDFSCSKGWSQEIIWCRTFDMNSSFCLCFIEEKNYEIEEGSFESESWE